MILRTLDRRHVTRYLVVVLLGAAIGGLHLRAAADVWGDDRVLAIEPSWVQLAAPRWHAAVDGSPSIARGLTRVVASLSGPSPGGHTRALAALLAALGASALILLLRRLQVPRRFAILLSGSMAAFVLPVSSALSVTHALQMLMGVGLALAALRPWFGSAAQRPAPSAQRVAVLVAITVVGVLNHASFVAYALPLWVATWTDSRRDARLSVAMAGLVALGGSLFASAWLLHLSASVPSAFDLDRPGLLAIARGVLTGRFAGDLQPVHTSGLISAAADCVPGPLLLCLPLAALAYAARETRQVAVILGGAVGLLWVFTASTWLPDPTVAGAPARLAVVVLVGTGLMWISVQPVRGATVLATVAAAAIGLNGFIDPSRWSTAPEIARFHAFVDAAADAVGDTVWTADRLAIDRALLGRGDPALEASRAPAGADLLRTVPDDRAVTVLGLARSRPTPAGQWTSSLGLTYRTVEDFLASQPNRVWIAVAARDEATAGTCRDLLAGLGVDPLGVPPSRLAVLARAGARPGAASTVAIGRLDVPYDQPVGRRGVPVPARFTIETDPVVRILVNGGEVARTDEGMALAVFDPWSLDFPLWRVGRCDEPALPAIRDPRLHAGYLVGPDVLERGLDIPTVASAPVRVRFDARGDDWFRSGWYRARGIGDNAFRWTRARDAHVNVVVNRRQPLRVRLRGQLARSSSQVNALRLSWNGTPIQPQGPWEDGREGVWTIPETLVRRGLNLFTVHVAHLVSLDTATRGAPARGAPSAAVGARLDRLSFEPLPAR